MRHNVEVITERYKRAIPKGKKIRPAEFPDRVNPSARRKHARRIAQKNPRRKFFRGSFRKMQTFYFSLNFATSSLMVALASP